jgi:hypothetical protein
LQKERVTVKLVFEARPLSLFRPLVNALERKGHIIRKQKKTTQNSFLMDKTPTSYSINGIRRRQENGLPDIVILTISQFLNQAKYSKANSFYSKKIGTSFN